MNEELIESYLDRAKVKSDTDFLESELKTVVDLFDKISKTKISLQGATSLKDVSAATEENVKTNVRLTESIKAVNSVITQRFASEAKLITIQTDYAKATATNRVELQKQNKELKDQAALNTANTGSIERARAAVRLLNTERNKLNLYTEEGREKQAKLNEQIDKYNAFIKKNVDALSRQKIEIGNYQGSAKIIVDALEKARVKVDQTVKSFGQLSPEAQAATREFESLRKITDQPQFLNIAAKVGDTNTELRFFVKQLNQLEDAGLKNSGVYKDVQARLAQLTDQLADTRQEVKALSSDTRGFDLFAGSVSFAADAFQTAAGAAALFGANEKDVQEITKNLVAVQSVANGVKGIANELTTKGTAANKAYAFVQGLVSTATNASASATVRLNAVLKLSTIGALVALVGTLIYAYNQFTDASNNAAKSTEEFKKKLDENSQALEGNLSSLDKNIERRKILNKTKFTGDSLKEADIETELVGISEKKLAVNKEINRVAGDLNDLIKQKKELEEKTSKANNAGISSLTEDPLNSINEKIKASNEKYLELIKKESDLSTAQTNIRLNQIADKRQAEFAANDEALKNAKDAAKKRLEDSKKAAEDALQAELELQRRKNTAVKELLIANANERIRINQAVADNEENEVGARINAAKTALAFQKGLAAQEYTDAIASETKIENGRKVIIAKTNEEKILAKTQYDNKVKTLEESSGKEILAIKKQNEEKILQQTIEEQQLELDILLKDKETKQAKIEESYNKDLIALNERFEKGKISQEKYNKKRERLDEAYHIASLQAEIEYTKKVLETLKLRGVDVSKELADLSKLELELSDLTKNRVLKNEDDKKAAAIDTIDKITQAYQVLSNIVSSALDAAATTQKNKIQEEIEAIDKRKEAELEANAARIQSDQDRAANTIVINARAQAEREKLERRQKEIDRQKAQAEKALSIFSITLSTAKNVADAKTPFGKILAAISGAAQLAIAIATPIPKFKHGKRAGNNYEGPGIVNDGPKMEAIERADGTIEFPQGRDVLTYVGKNDIIHPDKDAWLNAIMNAAHRDANASMRFTPESKKDNSLSIAMKKQTQLLQQIANKKELNLSAKQGGMEALWKWGANQTKYVNENTNWQ